MPHPNSFLGRLVVNLTVLLISFIAFSSQIFVIWPWYGSVLSVELIALLLPFNTLVGLLFWNYFLTVYTDPGGVPDDYRPNTTTDGFEVKRYSGTPRYCRSCEKFKPARAHHCRQCDRCVLRMDHHCPWTNNCIGHYNYAYFLRFLFYVDVACSYHIGMIVRRIMIESRRSYWNLSTSELIFILLNLVTCIPVLLAVGGFSIFHLSSLMSNTTTIEGWEKDKAATLVRRGKLREVKFPYNLGRRRNIETVLGPNPLWWCWPTPARGDGLTHIINDDEGEELGEWPPREQPSQPRFVQGDSPWTYGNETLNPSLRPSSARNRGRRGASNQGNYSNLPPYHPDYGKTQYGDDEPASDSSYDEEGHPMLTRNHVRRGSEGFEIRPANRETMLHSYLEQLGETPGKYHRYIPEPDSESEPEDTAPMRP
ncbi:zf-DHHC-domain-containing protein [Cylindrobasidium torrendii FP15055 ss-10]|uniref:Palmitoyltransferase PFA4 n=1 Tax=Cylindrobasidium torrendii FP15055 ss-10 TaxID=1314674 RepID=A0A0D7BTB3_9AGAR|nr:zf-DHHC-domain-containing protein [Cylindrobasidium torrendii FP15055 ss-10]